eukprot:TRINITY_DN33856_c0_g1_i5.p1 TRINITY_DN33856_c0_g1~~TRINITY_DN33856_c0_g1_i5.p1  ORF type:complete len:1685 (-),score=563.24 TRINITY_DN33856_c0_g1_i5:222-5276(-)
MEDRREVLRWLGFLVLWLSVGAAAAEESSGQTSWLPLVLFLIAFAAGFLVFLLLWKGQRSPLLPTHASSVIPGAIDQAFKDYFCSDVGVQTSGLDLKSSLETQTTPKTTSHGTQTAAEAVSEAEVSEPVDLRSYEEAGVQVEPPKKHLRSMGAQTETEEKATVTELADFGMQTSLAVAEMAAQTSLAVAEMAAQTSMYVAEASTQASTSVTEACAQAVQSMAVQGVQTEDTRHFAHMGVQCGRPDPQMESSAAQTEPLVKVSLTPWKHEPLDLVVCLDCSASFCLEKQSALSERLSSAASVATRTPSPTSAQPPARGSSLVSSFSPMTAVAESSASTALPKGAAGGSSEAVFSTSGKFERARGFIEELAGAVNMPDARIALVRFEDQVRSVLPFAEQAAALVAGARSLEPSAGESRLAPALWTSLQLLTGPSCVQSRAGWSASVPPAKAVLVITDGDSQDINDARRPAAALEEAGAQVLFVKVGSNDAVAGLHALTHFRTRVQAVDAKLSPRTAQGAPEGQGVFVVPDTDICFRALVPQVLKQLLSVPQRVSKACVTLPLEPYNVVHESEIICGGGLQVALSEKDVILHGTSIAFDLGERHTAVVPPPPPVQAVHATKIPAEVTYFQQKTVDAVWVMDAPPPVVPVATAVVAHQAYAAPVKEGTARLNAAISAYEKGRSVGQEDEAEAPGPTVTLGKMPQPTDEAESLRRMLQTLEGRLQAEGAQREEAWARERQLLEGRVEELLAAQQQARQESQQGAAGATADHGAGPALSSLPQPRHLPTRPVDAAAAPMAAMEAASAPRVEAELTMLRQEAAASAAASAAATAALRRQLEGAEEQAEAAEVGRRAAFEQLQRLQVDFLRQQSEAEAAAEEQAEFAQQQREAAAAAEQRLRLEGEAQLEIGRWREEAAAYQQQHRHAEQLHRQAEQHNEAAGQQALSHNESLRQRLRVTEAAHADHATVLEQALREQAAVAAVEAERWQAALHASEASWGEAAAFAEGEVEEVASLRRARRNLQEDCQRASLELHEQHEGQALKQRQLEHELEALGTSEKLRARTSKVEGFQREKFLQAVREEAAARWDELQMARAEVAQTQVLHCELRGRHELLESRLASACSAQGLAAEVAERKVAQCEADAEAAWRNADFLRQEVTRLELEAATKEARLCTELRHAFMDGDNCRYEARVAESLAMEAAKDCDQRAVDVRNQLEALNSQLLAAMDKASGQALRIEDDLSEPPTHTASAFDIWEANLRGSPVDGAARDAAPSALSPALASRVVGEQVYEEEARPELGIGESGSRVEGQKSLPAAPLPSKRAAGDVRSLEQEQARQGFEFDIARGESVAMPTGALAQALAKHGLPVVDVPLLPPTPGWPPSDEEAALRQEQLRAEAACQLAQAAKWQAEAQLLQAERARKEAETASLAAYAAQLPNMAPPAGAAAALMQSGARVKQAAAAEPAELQALLPADRSVFVQQLGGSSRVTDLEDSSAAEKQDFCFDHLPQHPVEGRASVCGGLDGSSDSEPEVTGCHEGRSRAAASRVAGQEGGNAALKYVPQSRGAASLQLAEAQKRKKGKSRATSMKRAAAPEFSPLSPVPEEDDEEAKQQEQQRRLRLQAPPAPPPQAANPRSTMPSAQSSEPNRERQAAERVRRRQDREDEMAAAALVHLQAVVKVAGDKLKDASAPTWR